jgi:hypothetical protein
VLPSAAWGRLLALAGQGCEPQVIFAAPAGAGFITETLPQSGWLHHHLRIGGELAEVVALRAAAVGPA